MKKLKLNLPRLEGAEVLTREQLKKVLGGDGSGGTDCGGSGCPSAHCEVIVAGGHGANGQCMTTAYGCECVV